MRKRPSGETVSTESESFHLLKPFDLFRPGLIETAAVFSSPHSGRAYFSEFVRSSRLSLNRLRASEDAYIDLLFDSAPTNGAPLLGAVAPRAFIDLNRSPSDIDPILVEGAPATAGNARVAAGLGVAPRIVAEGVSIYSGKLPFFEVRRRIELWYEPYHHALSALLAEAKEQFGWAMLLDCHSMPSSSQRAVRRRAADIVLGDCHGASAGARIVDFVQAAFEAEGFSVERNAPFAGGYITKQYGAPSLGMHAIQIELNRGVYLDERRVEPAPGFFDCRDRISAAVGEICRFAPDRSALEAAE